jgi:hypothetical protein
MVNMDTENMRTSGRHGAAWRELGIDVPDSERSPVALRWVVVGLALFWGGVIAIVRACA